MDTTWLNEQRWRMGREAPSPCDFWVCDWRKFRFYYKLTFELRFYYKKKFVKGQAKKIKLAVLCVVPKTLAGYFRTHEFRFYYKPVPPSTHGAVDDLRLIRCSFLALFREIDGTKSYEPKFRFYYNASVPASCSNIRGFIFLFFVNHSTKRNTFCPYCTMILFQINMHFATIKTHFVITNKYFAILYFLIIFF